MNRLPLHRTLIAAGALTGLLLLVPLVAMQFTAEVQWGAGDFLAAAVLLFLAIGTALLALTRLRSVAARAWAVAGILACLGGIWAELAVGLLD